MYFTYPSERAPPKNVWNEGDLSKNKKTKQNLESDFIPIAFKADQSDFFTASSAS